MPGTSSPRWPPETVVPRLRDRPDDLYALVSAASEATRIPVEFVEKDFWVTELLRTVVSAAAASGAVAVFKGRTSLSKAYRIVERFSEDVDILLVPPSGLGAEARHRVLKRICQAAAAHFGLVTGDGDVIQSETGIKRNVRFAYPARFEAGPLSPGVLLEMGVRGGPQPRTTMRLRSLTAEHAMAGGAEEGEFDELAIVEVEVLASER
jgi:Nucleotidyl transferase AbiEii toxin, Type IV TA system